MPYTKEYLEAGEFSITLRPDTPQSVLEVLQIERAAFATVIVTPTWVDPDEVPDEFILDRSNDGMAGVLYEQEGDRRVLSGDGLLAWLGTESDGGEVYVSADTTSADVGMATNLTTYVEDRGNGLRVESISTPGRVIKVPAGTTPRQFLDTIRVAYPYGPYEYRIICSGGTFTIHVDRSGALFDTFGNPTVVLASDGGTGTTTGTVKYLTLDGTGDYASTPDTAALDITGDLDIRVRATATDWTAANAQALAMKWNTTGNQRAYGLDVTTGGELRLNWSNNGLDVLSATSSGASLVNGDPYWLRATIDVNDGAGNRVITFYKSTDATTSHQDVTWTEISTTTAGTTSIYASTATLRAGSADNLSGTVNLTGDIHAVAVLSGLDDGTVVTDPVFSAWPSGTTSLADDAGLTWTLAGNAYINGEDAATITGLPADIELPSVDVRDWRSHVTVGDPNTPIVGTASNTAPPGWVNLDGDPPVTRTFVSSSPRTRFQDRPKKWGARIGASRFATWVLNSAAQAGRTAQSIATEANTHSYTVSADVAVDAVGRYLDCGDSVYVWDHRLGLVDTGNQIEYRGEPAHPAKLTVQRMEVPIVDGMGVYVWRDNYISSGFVLTDITRWVQWEEGPARLELGTRTWWSDRRKARISRLNRLRIKARARRDYLIGRYVGQAPSY